MTMLQSTLAILGNVRRSAAGTVRALAGLPAGVRHTRRGTVLVLILGALALIAVLTVVYVSIGQGDRRTGATTARRETVENAAQQIGDYISQIIADGAMATSVVPLPAGIGQAGSVTLVRNAADYPFTDPFRWSIASGATAIRKFNPAGSYDAPWVVVGGGLDLRLASTPFLASTLPSTLPGATAPSTWDHISNLSPDGKFVNLWNLAPIIGGVRYSAWDASSSFNPATGPVTPSIDQVNGRVLSQMAFGMPTLGATGAPAIPTGNAPSGTSWYNLPAFWSTNQQQLFRPAKGPIFYDQTAGQDPLGLKPNSPGSMWYAPYLFADADGDGYFDSRWFELVDSSDPANIRSLLPRDNVYRWFIAARVMDLSALVNVNTATDFRTAARPPNPPASTDKNQVYPVGLGPSDIDLRRLLTMSDTYSTGGLGNSVTGYAALHQPTGGVGPRGADDYSQYDKAAAQHVGDQAYSYLRDALRPEGASVLAATGQMPAFNGDQREVYYINAAKPGTFSQRPSGQPTGEYLLANGQFDASDLKELLTFYSINNPLVTSRLEQTTEGRYTADPGFGPLRANRGPGVDDWTSAPLDATGIADTQGFARSEYDIRQLITPLNTARAFRSSIITDTGVPDPSKHKSVLFSGDLAVDAVAALKAAAKATGNEWVHDQNDPSILFNGYCDALLPYAGVPGAWNQQAGFWGLSYGYNPQLALRMAAHMTANMIDSYTKPHSRSEPEGGTTVFPSAFTLLMDPAARLLLNQSTQQVRSQFPWWYQPGAGTPATTPGRLDLGDSKLKRANDTPQIPQQAQALNVFGIKPQPFLIQVASFVAYTDTPESLGGDADGSASASGPITIKGDFDATGNPDFLGEVLAFQLTNPFDQDIPLTGPDMTGSNNGVALNQTKYSDYYIEYAGNYFLLAKYDDGLGSTGALHSVVLRAGETRVFYALSNGSTTNGRWTHIDGTDPNILSDFVNHQLAMTALGSATADLSNNRVSPVRVARFDPASGVLREGTPVDLLKGSGGGAVHLWRLMRSGSGLGGANSDPTNTPNVITNDLLVDRLRDPTISPGTDASQSVLNRKLLVGEQPVGLTQAGPEGTAGAIDNTGFTIVRWGCIKRYDDPSAPNVPRGAIPAYCVEAKWGVGSSAATGFKNLKKLDKTDTSTTLKRADFVGGIGGLGNANGIANADKTFIGLMGRVAPVLGSTQNTNGVLIMSMITPAPHKSDDPMVSNLDQPAKAYKDLYPQIGFNQKEYTAHTPANGTIPQGPDLSILRVTDLLLPLAIGPEYYPLVVGSESFEPDGTMHPGWITLSEALGAALNYSSPQTYDPTDPYNVYYKIGETAAQGAPDHKATDRGNLLLDHFVPFVDANANGTLDAGERTFFPGIPLALRVLDVFSAMPGGVGDLTHGIPGQINANTAPLQVMRTVPLLAPTRETQMGGAGFIWDDWVTSAIGNLSPAPSLPTVNSDVAAGEIAYRDRSLVHDRANTNPDFRDGGLGGGNGLFNPANWNGRFQTLAIPGLREAPGFVGRGELLALTNNIAHPDHTAGSNPKLPDADQIDGLAYDKKNSGAAGINTALYKNAAGTGTDIDTISDDFQEKLLIASGVMNSVTVRSDMFAVWFVVNGYTEADTQNLHPFNQNELTNGIIDPLVPSVAKRYLMVVDRSNVTRVGQKPRIVMFTEVPMTP